MYEIVDDTYCYPGTTILKNKLDIRHQKRLQAFETEMTSQRAMEPLPSGEFSAKHYYAIHKHLFQDVYAWAGKPRTLRMSKGGNPFCFPEHIDKQMAALFEQLKSDRYLRGLGAGEFAGKAAHVLAELNAIHPFREGNGRTQLTFLALLAEKAGHPLDAARLDPQGMMNAMIASFETEEGLLSQMILDLIRPSGERKR